MNLKDLIKEINYQEAYSYDRRVDLFNKYAISTAQKAFNPIYELAKFIIDKRTILNVSYKEEPITSQGLYTPYSHSGALLSTFNEEVKQDKSSFVKHFEDKGTIYIYGYSGAERKHIPILIFNEKDKTITIKRISLGFIISRNLYDQIDEWLIDFGYEKW